jgi:transposase
MPVALIEPMLSAWRAQRAGLGIAKIQHDLREIVNAVLYVNRTGVAWEYLPHDFPPYKTVHGYFALWEKEGITEAIHDALRGKVRQDAGRSPEPSAAILDAQTVKTSANVPEHSQGIDAGKKIKGRKRHVATDVLGLLFVVLVTAASVQDTTCGRGWCSRWPVSTPRWRWRGWTLGTSRASLTWARRTVSTCRSSLKTRSSVGSSRNESGGR